MVFSIFNQKGGVGKSTLATCLADVLNYSATACLVDLDKQGTITQAATLDSFPVAVREVEDVAEIPKLPEKVTIVDSRILYWYPLNRASPTTSLFTIRWNISGNPEAAQP